MRKKENKLAAVKGEQHMTTIKEIADRAGVSTTTVSNVIHGKTKKVSPANVEKIQNLIKEMGYVQKMGLRILNNESSQLIAVVINAHKQFDNTILGDPFYGKILGFIEEQVRAAGYYMIFYSAGDIDDIFRMVMAWDVDGVIALTFTRRDCAKIRHLINKPVVSIDAYGELDEPQTVVNIGLDDAEGGYLMTRHLLESGYKQVFVCASRDHAVDHLRWEGAKRAYKDHGSEKQKLQFIALGQSKPERKKSYQDLLHQMPFKKKTALFFLSDYFALEAISYFSDHDISVPKQVGIAGFDDILYSKLSVPKLTTVRQDIRQKAVLAVDNLLDQLKAADQAEDGVQGEEGELEKLLPVTLVTRQSV